jgi:hypothetical protein
LRDPVSGKTDTVHADYVKPFLLKANARDNLQESMFPAEDKPEENLEQQSSALFPSDMNELTIELETNEEMVKDDENIPSAEKVSEEDISPVPEELHTSLETESQPATSDLLRSAVGAEVQRSENTASVQQPVQVKVENQHRDTPATRPQQLLKRLQGFGSAVKQRLSTPVQKLKPAVETLRKRVQFQEPQRNSESESESSDSDSDLANLGAAANSPPTSPVRLRDVQVRLKLYSEKELKELSAKKKTRRKFTTADQAIVSQNLDQVPPNQGRVTRSRLPQPKPTTPPPVRRAKRPIYKGRSSSVDSPRTREVLEEAHTPYVLRPRKKRKL